MARILIVAPHADDEVLGVGGTIARKVSEGDEVVVAFMTRGRPPMFPESLLAVVRAESEAAAKLLGVHQVLRYDLPAAQIDTLPHHEVNQVAIDLLAQIQPATLFLPFVGDIHRDHQLLFQSMMVAARPVYTHAPRTIYAFETLSETNWNAPQVTPAFVPNVFIDIEKYLDQKIAAMQLYRSQVKEFPNERSIESIRALARLRGSAMGMHAAEAFMLIRSLQ